jgi:hypothetical protein
MGYQKQLVYCTDCGTPFPAWVSDSDIELLADDDCVCGNASFEESADGVTTPQSV